MKKKENNFWKNWKNWAILILIILFFLNYNITKEQKDKYIEYQKTCIGNCISEFETCMDNVTSYNLEYGIKTTPQDPKILSCLWGENFCVESCQMYDHKLWKAMGRPE